MLISWFTILGAQTTVPKPVKEFYNSHLSSALIIIMMIADDAYHHDHNPSPLLKADSGKSGAIRIICRKVMHMQVAAKVLDRPRMAAAF
jgi:hypothetical protein